MSLTLEELKWATILALTEPPQRTKPKEAPTVTPYLTFYSPDGEFRMTKRYGKTWDGIMEWSTDNNMWTIWDGTDYIYSSSGYIYLRGTNNTIISGQPSPSPGAWSSISVLRLSGDSQKVFCNGNIETLLDYQTVMSGVSPRMGDYCFANLFAQSHLSSLPDLPSQELTLGCYEGFSRSNHDLLVAPDLPAKILKQRCYNQMFLDTASLSVAPKISAETLAEDCCMLMFSESGISTLPKLRSLGMMNSCYESMFAYCANIRISEIQSAEYPFSFRIPYEGTGYYAEEIWRNPCGNMFYRTGGPFTGTPEINTTYYTDHEPV